MPSELREDTVTMNKNSSVFKGKGIVHEIILES